MRSRTWLANSLTNSSCFSSRSQAKILHPSTVSFYAVWLLVIEKACSPSQRVSEQDCRPKSTG